MITPDAGTTKLSDHSDIDHHGPPSCAPSASGPPLIGNHLGCSPKECVHRRAGRHTAHVGPCLRLLIPRAARDLVSFASIIDEQRRRFVSDSRARGQRLATGALTMPVFASMQPRPKKEAPVGKLPLAVCILVASFCHARVITSFLDELGVLGCCERRGRIDGSIVATRSFVAARSLRLFKNLFVAYAGVLGLCALPLGAFYTGSLCCAGAAMPGCVSARADQIEALRPAQFSVPPLVVRWLRKRIGALASRVGLFLAPSTKDANEYLELFNGVLGERTSYFGLHDDLAANELDEMEAPRGAGVFARADIDIIIVAKDDEEARSIITETLALVRTAVGAHIVVQTPNGLTVVPDFPQKHVQIITLWNRSLAEYFDFVDLDCTALAFDGVRVYGSPRALLAWTSRFNVVHPDMLRIRKDTPARIAKYCQRGFGCFLLGHDQSNTAEEREDIDKSWARCEELSRRGAGRFMNRGGVGDEADYAQFLLEAHGSCYSENRLPRGVDITPQVVEEFLERCWDRARREDRRFVVKQFGPGDIITCALKLRAKTERWWRWGMA